MDAFPQRSIRGVAKKTSARTVLSGVVADLTSMVRRLLGKIGGT